MSNPDHIGKPSGYKHDIEADNWREAEGERKTKAKATYRVQTTDAARTMEQRLRAKGTIVGPPNPRRATRG